MLSAGLLSCILLAASAVARPSGLAGRIARRRAGSHLSQPLQRSELISDQSNVEYSSNWAGAVYAEGDGTYTAVTGTFVVPTPSAPSGGSGTYSAAAWVGIDGDTCDNAILQTGVDFTVDGGEVSYDAWYEWYPDYAYDFSGISISAGDTIKTTVTATSTTSGTAVIENVSTGQTVTQSLTSSYALCEENAEWIVEDYEENGGLVSFADFGTVTFTDAVATTSSGTQGPSGATLIDIEQNGNVLTSASVSSSEVVVKYT
ncbi:hypothetical protein POSPLADRAFT_1141136 [Postia placenta MAD-698-R-SB12]|uniref:Aspergillopepsin n=1 Tax=Postia placenta MAD-698-R-SB12 TaxID=670580 RepID=A0A1X6N1L7_9APHY|nr:hypothetical protein POSPLADRAFT_1141136 [Postia placenta MAD-698-R-SB12]OSX62515.1 hypothetical protein POSPLADRAFT_1141136 [Postia placenta MAD-698-R-SB12]